VPGPGPRRPGPDVRRHVRPVARPAPPADLGRCGTGRAGRRPRGDGAGVRGGLRQWPGARPAPPGDRIHPRGSHQRRHRRRDRARDPGAAHARPQRRRSRRADAGPAPGGHPSGAARRSGPPRRGGVPGRDHPLPALPCLADRRPNGRPRGPRRRGPRGALAAGGPGDAGHRLRPLRSRGHARLAGQAAGRRRRGVDARHRHVRDHGDDGRRAVRGHGAWLRVPQHRPGGTPRPRCAHGGSAVRAPRGRRARSLRGRAATGRPPRGEPRQRGADPAHRRRHVRHRDQPHGHDRRRHRAGVAG
jgi:hypothetical protein